MSAHGPDPRLRVLFLVEGFTDVRFVVGLSDVCELTLAIPLHHHRSSGLDRRLAELRPELTVHEIRGGRLAFQAASVAYLLRTARGFDVILAQEVTRGALNANLVGWLLGVPVLNTLALPPVEYFRCRWQRRLLPWWRYWIGDKVIRGFLALNGRLASGWLALGPYLRTLALRHSRHVRPWGYYGVDTDYFRPVSPDERCAIRHRRGLPLDAFLIVLASRVSHEKDPESALRAVDQLRRDGLDAVLLNLGGGHHEFVRLARDMGFSDVDRWVLGPSAAHPMTELAEYYQTADVVVQSSLEEGLGFAPLEALACGVPVVATAVGGMAAVLRGRALLVPRQCPRSLAGSLLWVSKHPDEARDQSLRARDSYVIPTWDRTKVFQELAILLRAVAETGRLTPDRSPDSA